MGNHNTTTNSYFNLTIKRQLLYFSLLNVSFHEINSIFGFVTFITIIFQIISGVMLSFSLIPEPMLIPIVRDEEDMEDSYTDDFFWMHERGVDIIVMYSYFHLFRKLYIKAYDYEHDATWKSGVYSWLILQGVIFFGLTLCCTHLSEITLTIAANILHTFFFFYGKFYWWIFTDKQLNCDTIVRVAYLHYVSAFYLLYVGYIHSIDMHYDWKNEVTFDGVSTQLQWNDEVSKGELWFTAELLAAWALAILVMLRDPEALSYEIFTWGDIGFMTDVRFYGVAPHWYFRPFMSWLITCPHHKTGIFGLIYFFLIVFYQPVIHGCKENDDLHTRNLTILKPYFAKNAIIVSEYHNVENNLYTQLTCWFFIYSCLYTSSFLPYGRFYNRVRGNFGSLMSFMYVFAYLTFPFLRKPYVIEFSKIFVYDKTKELTIVIKKK